MLTIFRRHTPDCKYFTADKARTEMRCGCPLHADGYIDGKRTRKSLGTSDAARARRKLLTLESGDGPVYKPINEAVTAFLVNCQHLNLNTQRKYRNRLEKQLLPFCATEGVEDLAALKVEVLDRFRAQRALSITTAVRELETLRQFFTFCMDREWIKDNPAKRIKTPRDAKSKPVVPYTPAEVDAILAAASTIGKCDYERKRARAMVLLLRYAALRISDVALLERSSVQGEELLLHAHKTGVLVRLPMPTELRLALEDVPIPHGADPATSRYYFINGTGSARTAISVAERCLQSVFKASKVQGARAHRYRHTIATEILTNGGTMRDVADILGTSESVAAKHYAKWDSNRQSRVSRIMRSIYLDTRKSHKLKLVASR